jgi:hypothetical protein
MPEKPSVKPKEAKLEPEIAAGTKALTPAAEVPERPRRSLWSYFKAHRKRILWIATLLLAVPGALQKWSPVPPRITIALGESARKSDPLSVPFKVKNEGWMSTGRVEADCHLLELQIGSARMVDSSISGLTGARNSEVRRLEHGEEMTVRCGISSNAKLTAADIAFTVDYSGILGRSRVCERFVGIQTDDGWRWERQSCSAIRDRL